MHANGFRIVCLVVPPALISLSRSVLQQLGRRRGVAGGDMIFGDDFLNCFGVSFGVCQLAAS